MEHVLPTTAEFVRQLDESGVEISTIIGKPYSIHPPTAELLAKTYELVVKTSYKDLEASGAIRSALEKALRLSAKDGKRVVVLDVGGYFAAAAAELDKADLALLAGIVEDTTFGHNRYQDLCERIGVPVCSVARSDLKAIEAQFVGRDAVVAMEDLLRRIGISITGRNALVIGYGMIGKSIARSLKDYGLNVYVYDKEDRRLLHAFNDGFHIHKKTRLLRRADIIFSATGSEALYGVPAMSLAEIEECKHGVILASAGSRNTEFSIEELAAQALDTKRLIDGCDDLVRFRMSNSKDVIVARMGTAVNFHLYTMPIEILDLVFAEIVEAVIALHRGGWHRRMTDGSTDVVETNVGAINETPSSHLDLIAKEWLRYVNIEA